MRWCCQVSHLKYSNWYTDLSQSVDSMHLFTHRMPWSPGNVLTCIMFWHIREAKTKKLKHSSQNYAEIARTIPQLITGWKKWIKLFKSTKKRMRTTRTSTRYPSLTEIKEAWNFSVNYREILDILKGVAIDLQLFHSDPLNKLNVLSNKFEKLEYE